jgi:MFS family permease
MVAMNVVYALAAYPAGVLSDRLGRSGLLVSGFLVLIAADLVLGYVDSIAGVLTGAGLWGLHMGLTQGVLSSLVADTAPSKLRATGFGLFNVAGGLALFAASAIAGLLWQTMGPAATFLAGAGFAAVALAAFLALDGKIAPTQ